MVSENECKTFTVGVTHFVRPPSQIWDSLGLALEGRRRQPRRACTSVWFWSSLNEDTFYQLRISQRFVKTQGKPLTKSSTVPSVVSGLGMYFVLRYVDRVAFPMVPCLISTPPTKIWAYRPSSASTRRFSWAWSSVLWSRFSIIGPRSPSCPNKANERTFILATKFAALTSWETAGVPSSIEEDVVTLVYERESMVKRTASSCHEWMCCASSASRGPAVDCLFPQTSSI
jgi:hypothetical protein